PANREALSLNCQTPATVFNRASATPDRLTQESPSVGSRRSESLRHDGGRSIHSISVSILLRGGAISMRIVQRYFTALLAVSISTVPLAAQQPTPPDTLRSDTAHANPTQVDTARRSVQLRSVTITAAPADRREASSASHVSQAQIQQTPATSPWDLLRQTAGVEVHLQGQGPGFASDASVRGFSSDHSTDLALWIDGVPINEPVNGHAEGYNDWSLIFPAAVRDVDVIKGPTSALFGNFALSGTVNVRTLERMTGTQGDVTGGNFGRGEASLMTGFDHGTTGGGVFGLRGLHECGFRPNSMNHLFPGHGRIVYDVGSGVTLAWRFGWCG